MNDEIYWPLHMQAFYAARDSILDFTNFNWSFIGYCNKYLWKFILNCV
jgi:hypothetical protein